MKCAVRNCCQNSQVNNLSRRVLFRFPKNKELLEKWIRFCKNENNFNPETWRVCMSHFNAEDICVWAGKRALRPGVIPRRYNCTDAVELTESKPKIKLEVETEDTRLIEHIKTENGEIFTIYIKEAKAISVEGAHIKSEPLEFSNTPTTLRQQIEVAKIKKAPALSINTEYAATSNALSKIQNERLKESALSKRKEILQSRLKFQSTNEELIKRRQIQRKIIRQRVDIFKLSDSKFQNYFRLSKEAFKYVLETIQPKMKSGIRSTSIPNGIKLAATLRFLAQGSYQICFENDFNLGLAQPTVSQILKETIEVLETVICPLWIRFDMTEAERDEAKLAFFKKTGFPGVIGCIGGTHIKILAPNREHKTTYYNRKGFYSLNAMIICDHKMRIRCLDACQAGSAHDAMVWKMSYAKRILDESYNSGDDNSWLLGNANYPLEPYLMTPYCAARAMSAEAVFNAKHAKARHVLESTIGALKNSFRCLLGDRQLHYKPDKATKIVNVCSALHNICIEYGEDFASDNISLESNEEDFEIFDDDAHIQSIEALQKRDEIRDSFI